MEGFGYRAVEAEGEWTEGFETRIFRPRNQPKEVWWFHYMGISRADIPKGMAINHIPIRAVGFLSPAGHYGHFGSGDHQFYATSITLLDGNQPGELPRAK